MKKIYNHQKYNKNIYHIWVKKNNEINKKNYSITIPPPNITGELHLGHAYQSTLMDILIRFYSMNKYNCLWKMGTDHAGIATQILIEQKINNKTNKNFYDEAKSWKKFSSKKIRKQLKSLGCLLNWNTERFTLDGMFSYSVKEAFIRLYNEGLIYKSNKLVHWDIKMQTAISDLETIYKEQKCNLYYIKYFFDLANKNEFLLIATSRPETIFADVAVAINPNDQRYKKYSYKYVYVPIINKKIPIIYDKIVDISFGSGCLKITPAHDFNDFEIGAKNNLPIINILKKDGKMNDNVPNKYKNFYANEAKDMIIKDLNEQNLIFKIEEYKTKIPFADRSGSIVEPMITDQWYVKVNPLIKPVYTVLKNKKITIIPDKWSKIFYNWINNIKDWCISRQIIWGHRIPVWYDSKNKIYVGHSDKEIKKKFLINENEKLIQDSNVLDTWFSSALWPFASLGWPKKTIEYKKYYPTNILITGFDIIFFWAIRMMMFSLKFTKTIPFKEIYIHGLIRDNLGNKMSKTKGNVLDPKDIINGISEKDLINKQIKNLIDIKKSTDVTNYLKKNFPTGIESFGADSLRLYLSSISSDNISIKLDLTKIKNYKNFCNKLWNSYLFITKYNLVNKFYFFNRISIYDKWIISKWQTIKNEIILNIKNKKFSYAVDNIYKFFWNDFCSSYIEMYKILFKINYYKKFLHNNMLFTFKEILKIIHPFAPYITDKIWYNMNDKKNSILLQIYPKKNFKYISIINENYINLFNLIISKIRQLEKKIIENNIFYIKFSKNYNIENIENILPLLKKFLKIKNIFFFNKEVNNKSSIIINDNVQIYIKNMFNINYEKKTIIKNKINMLKILLNNKEFLKNANINTIKNKKLQLIILEKEYLNI
jgi:valyl-tRNA synthetase